MSGRHVGIAIALAALEEVEGGEGGLLVPGRGLPLHLLLLRPRHDGLVE